jgi:hypothetical protein
MFSGDNFDSMQRQETLMHAVANRLKMVSAAGVFTLGLCFAATSANAEAKSTTNWNAASFGAACNAAATCNGGTQPNGDFKAQIHGDNTITNVRCNANSCSYSTVPAPGGPAPTRVAAPDKTLGTGVGLGGLLAGGARPARTPKLNAGQDVPRQIKGQVGKIETPKVDVPRQIKVEVPKVSAPAGNLKDTKVNVLR